jgi:hypothetical protein
MPTGGMTAFSLEREGRDSISHVNPRAARGLPADPRLGFRCYCPSRSRTPRSAVPVPRTVSGKKKSRAIRNVNRRADDRLWDDAGREWQRVEADLSRDRAARLLNNPAVRVGVHDDFGRPVRWVDSTQREAFWRNEAEPEFAKLKVRPPDISRTRYSRTRLFEASLWRSGADEIVYSPGISYSGSIMIYTSSAISGKGGIRTLEGALHPLPA